MVAVRQPVLNDYLIWSECANARLSTRPGLVSCTEPSTNPAWGAKLGRARML